MKKSRSSGPPRYSVFQKFVMAQASNTRSPEQAKSARRNKSMEPGKKATIKDIAAHCSVSLMTVSRVLNNKGGISKKTASRVWEAARELNYTPNLVAKSLRVKETRTLGVVISDSSHLLFAKMLKGIGDAATTAGYSIIFANTNQVREAEREAINVLMNKRIDGLILAAPLRTDEETLREIAHFGVPFVLLMRSSGANVDSVVNDNYHGAYELTDYLARTGSTDIGMINLPRESQSGKERARGYRQALRDHGLAYDPRKHLHAAPHIEDGGKAMARLLERGLRKGAVLCGCDLIAIGAMQTLFAHGLRVPEDVRIGGYDDIEMLDYMKAPLTTMRQPAYEIGQCGVKLLLERIKHPRRETERIVLASELIVRQST